MLLIVRAALVNSDPALPEVSLRVDRITLAKRIWRGTADDGCELGFDLEAPVQHGDTVHQSSSARYVVRQEAENLLEISLAIAPSAAAGIGWAIGNLHLELQAEATRLLALDEPAMRQLLARLRVPFAETKAVFRPGRFTRGPATSVNELGSSHRH